MFGFEKNLDAAGIRPDIVFGSGSFLVNGALDPVAASNAGSLKGRFTVTHAATGLYLVQMAVGFVFPPANSPIIECSNSIASTVAVWSSYITYPTSAGWQNSARQFQINTALSATPNTPADLVADARNVVAFFIEGIDGTSK